MEMVMQKTELKQQRKLNLMLIKAPMVAQISILVFTCTKLIIGMVSTENCIQIP